ncbi:MAG: relaxase/mobilization nuclease domain-containing protein [Eggerthellaceae bacterium]|nr:relaxase/mobilization nuclease domain-containing protein [Eggerthellaceae bacterium]
MPTSPAQNTAQCSSTCAKTAPISCSITSSSADGSAVATALGANSGWRPSTSAAHVVVNNTNLETGGRLRDPDPRALKRALQRISAEHGLSALADHESVPWRRRRVGRAEREIMAKGEYSWVADIRERIAVARGTARTERDFVALLGRMGVVVEPSRSREGDWVYALAETPTRRVTGAKLGSAYTRSGVNSAMRTAMRSASPKAAERIVKLANGAIEVRDLRELGELAHAIGFVSRNNIRSLAEMDRVISRSRDGSKTARLKAVRESCEHYGLLPQTAPKPTVVRRLNPDHDDGRRRPNDNGSHQRHHEQSTPSRGRER